MLEGLKFRRKLRKLQRDKRELQASYGEELKEARRSKDHEKVQEINSLWSFEGRELDEEIALLQSGHIRALASRYLIPVPEFDEHGAWIESESTGRWHLSAKAILRLRSSIYEERKHRRDFWMPWLSMIIGLTGAGTGLIAALAAWGK